MACGVIDVPRRLRMTRIAYVLPLALAVSACSTSGDPNHRISGQTEFVSAPMAGSSSGGRGNGVSDGTAGAPGAGGAGTPAVTPMPTRTVEVTDLYRLAGTHLHYFN